MYCDDGCGTQPLNGVSLGVLPLLVGEPKQHKAVRVIDAVRLITRHSLLSPPIRSVFIWDVYHNT